MRFVKMHGIGNDYVYVDCFRETVKEPRNWRSTSAIATSGLGGTGLS